MRPAGKVTTELAARSPVYGDVDPRRAPPEINTPPVSELGDRGGQPPEPGQAVVGSSHYGSPQIRSNSARSKGTSRHSEISPLRKR
jgi:hypothetical protein